LQHRAQLGDRHRKAGRPERRRVEQHDVDGVGRDAAKECIVRRPRTDLRSARRERQLDQLDDRGVVFEDGDPSAFEPDGPLGWSGRPRSRCST
jgi:hypothetical protein